LSGCSSFAAGAVREQLESVGQFVIDFEHIAVRIGEIDAALRNVIGGPEDLDTLLDQVSISLTRRAASQVLETSRQS
jgi:hypothetical protein